MSTPSALINLRVPKTWLPLLKRAAEENGYAHQHGKPGTGYSALIRAVLADEFNLPLPETDFKSET